MISVYKIESSYVTVRKHRGAPAPGAPMVPTPMGHTAAQGKLRHLWWRAYLTAGHRGDGQISGCLVQSWHTIPSSSSRLGPATAD